MPPLLMRLLVPLLCFAAALIVRGEVVGDPLWHRDEDVAFLLRNLPYILLLLAMLLALLSHHAVEAGVTLSMLCIYWLIQTYLQVRLETQPALQIYYLISLVAPCSIIFYALIPEQSWRQPLGLLAIGLSPMVLLITSSLLALNENFMAASAQQGLAASVFGTHLSLLSISLFFLCFMICLGLSIHRQKTLESSLLGCTLMIFATLGWIQLSAISAFMFAGIGVLLIINLTGSLLNIGFRDELTQIGNRRALRQAAKALRGPYSVAMVDADYFKKINDQFGHDLGDQALRVIASLLTKTAEGAKPFRYGGEEFCLLFKSKSKQEVLQTLEQIRLAIANYDMVVRNKKQRPKKPQQGEKRRGASKRSGELRLTVSIGVANGDGSRDFEQVLKQADRALYRAKAKGRNQVQAA